MKLLLKLFILFMLTGMTVGLAGLVMISRTPEENRPWVEPPTMDKVVESVLADRLHSLGKEQSELEPKDEINILLIGLDARKDWDEPHCDANHMFTLNLEKKTLTITSVPRGTSVWFPGPELEANQYYLANSCAYQGIDYGVKQIEKITGKKTDFLVTVGFSQAMGVFRLFDLPTTETLQWLRHRQSYSIGEPQRSHNQAVFMKDAIISYLDRFRSDATVPLQYALFTMVDTDMDFGTMRTLLSFITDAELDKNPDNISLAMKPYYPTKDYHFDVEHADEQIQELVDFLKPYLSAEDLSNRSLEDVQNELITHLENRLESDEPIDDIMQKQLWLQIDDDEIREKIQFAFMERHLEEISGQRSVVMDTLTIYIIEKEALGQEEYAQKGRDLLTETLNKNPFLTDEEAEEIIYLL